jgi:hypothetical protein
VEAFLQVFIIFNIFIIGTLFGSFFSLATYRLPRKQDIVSTRSYCPNCKHNLNFFDLIPVLSYLFSNGKCRYCSEHISARYILMEMINGIVFVLVYALFGFTIISLVIITIYIALFLLIGSKIMDKNMSDKEREEISKIKSKSNFKLSSKKGVFILELIVAAIIFIVFLVSAIVSSRNYDSKMASTVIKANAVNIAVKNMEIALATNYDDLNSFSNSETLNNVNYSVTVTVTKYSDIYFDKQDLVKTVEIKVDYMLSGKSQSFKVSSLSKREI